MRDLAEDADEATRWLRGQTGLSSTELSLSHCYRHSVQRFFLNVGSLVRPSYAVCSGNGRLPRSHGP